MAQLKDLIVNGPSRFIGDVYATTFTGNLAGNANTATSATNAGTIAGLSVHSGRNNEANKIVRTDGNGYLQVGYINSSSGHEKNASSPTYVWGSNSSDSYLRSYQTSSLSVNYATSSGSCSGNAATATKAGCLDTGTMTLYANGGNEINFGGTNTSSNIYFGYRATGSKPVPTSFIFGGSGTATLTAGGFKKNGSSASYVLTGDGGHAAISGLSVNYANSSGSCSGNAATATNASSAGNADKLDGYHLSQITPVVTKRDFTNGTLVKTNISFPGTNTSVSEPFLLTVRGNGYGAGIINFEFQGYVYYASSYTHPQIINSDFIIYSPNSIDKIYTMSIDNKLCFWWARQSYWQGFHIFCTTNTQRYQNRVTEVQDVSKPSGLFEQIYTPKLSLTTSNYTSYTVTKTGGEASGTWNISITGNAATATNADLLDGQHLITQVSDWNTDSLSIFKSSENSISNAPTSDFIYGVTLRFHRSISVYHTDLVTSLYHDRLFFRRKTEEGYQTWRELIHSGNIGSQSVNYATTSSACTGNSATATKLQTARTIWGQSFDGTGNVKGAMSDVEVINFADNWMTIGIVRNSSNVKDLVIQSEEAYPISISSGGLKLRISARDLDWGDNIIYHSGNCNFPDTPWNCSKLYAENSVSTIRGEFRYIEFSRTNLYTNNGGYIDFHYNGSTADYTSRIIEDASGQLTVTGKLRVGLNDAASTNYAFYVDGDGYFVDNVITEGDFSSRGDAIIDGHAKVNSLKASNICIECDNSGNSAGHTSEINNYSRPLYIQYSTSNNCCICYGGGNVGIGITSPTYKLHVSGDARIDGTISCIKLSQTSDIKYKTNIKQIEYEEALKIIENLNPVTWDWNENTVETGSSSGFVAQEAEEFIPNAISRDNENNLSLDYTQLHSYEIKVIQEQQKEIIKLKEKLKILEKLIS